MNSIALINGILLLAAFNPCYATINPDHQTMNRASCSQPWMPIDSNDGKVRNGDNADPLDLDTDISNISNDLIDKSRIGLNWLEEYLFELLSPLPVTIVETVSEVVITEPQTVGATNNISTELVTVETLTEYNIIAESEAKENDTTTAENETTENNPATESETAAAVPRPNAHEIKRLPLKLLAKTVNAVSKLMQKDTIGVYKSSPTVFDTLMDRFKIILKRLRDAEDNELLASNNIDKAKVEQTLNRVKQYMKNSVDMTSRSRKVNRILNVITGNDTTNKDNAECYKEVAECFVRHALTLYSEIPGISFDSEGALLVDGQPFPAPEEVQASRDYFKDYTKKRRCGDDAIQSPAKKKKVDRQQSNSYYGRYKGNFYLLIKLHNCIAKPLDGKVAYSVESMTNLYTRMTDSLIMLVEMVVDSGIVKYHPIHDQYPIDMQLLKSLKRYLRNNSMPKKYQTVWLLDAFDVAGNRDYDGVGKLRLVAYWYAAVAFSAFASIVNVEFESGELMVAGEPLLKQVLNS